MKEYQTPKAELTDGSEELSAYDRSLWLLVPANLYIWWKIYDYIDLYIWGVRNLSPIEMLILSINIPIYVSAILYIFKLKAPPLLFWRIWIVVAIADETRESIVDYDGIIDFLQYVGPVIPLYIIGLVYAYLSPSIWKQARD